MGLGVAFNIYFNSHFCIWCIPRLVPASTIRVNTRPLTQPSEKPGLVCLDDTCSLVRRVFFDADLRETGFFMRPNVRLPGNCSSGLLLGL